MTLLDQRRTQILSRMGVSVWKLREAEDYDLTEDLSSDSETENPEHAEMPETLDAKQFASLEAVSQAVMECQRCPLALTRNKTVPGAGNPEAKWMFIGEAPGRDEDMRGLPFVGRAGQLLDSIFTALGLDRDQVFIANAVKCRPPGNRDPEENEVRQCKPYLQAQVAMIKPHVIVALGRISARLLLKVPEQTSLASLRGRVHSYDETGIPLVVTYHPAYLLRSPDQKQFAWQDLLLAKSQIK